jgi:hypothetical protein
VVPVQAALIAEAIKGHRIRDRTWEEDSLQRL